MHEYLRQDNEPPAAIARHGWRYHHIGIPTQTPRPDEIHVPHLHIHVAGFQTSPFGVQWMRFDPDAPYPEAVKTIPHVALKVDDLAISTGRAGDFDSAEQSERGSQSGHVILELTAPYQSN